MAAVHLAAVVLLALVLAALFVPAFGRAQAGRAESVCGGPASAGDPWRGLYAPACGARAPPGGLSRAACAGPTSGAMPAIDFEGGPLTGECCGRLGVPP
jgi:hypothetical protein